MNAKVTMVRLYAPSLNLTKPFDAEHAERLLRTKNSGWQVADDEKLEWTDNGFRPKSYKRGGKDSK